MRMSAILEEDDAFLAAEGGDPVDLKSDVPSDVNHPNGRRLERLDLLFQVFKGKTEVGCIAVDEFDRSAGLDDALPLAGKTTWKVLPRPGSLTTRMPP